MRLWTKQLDEGVHDAGIAVLSFALAFRHQYLTRGEAGKAMLESIPDPAKRERRRDVIEKGLDSPFFKTAIARLLTLYRDMDKALASHAWLAGDDYSIADAAFTPYVVRLEHLDVMGLLDPTPAPPTGTAGSRPARASRPPSCAGRTPIPRADETPGPRKLAQNQRDHGCSRVYFTIVHSNSLAIRRKLHMSPEPAKARLS